jgi:hypothetical protein
VHFSRSSETSRAGSPSEQWADAVDAEEAEMENAVVDPKAEASFLSDDSIEHEMSRIALKLKVSKALVRKPSYSKLNSRSKKRATLRDAEGDEEEVWLTKSRRKTLRGLTASYFKH